MIVIVVFKYYAYVKHITTIWRTVSVAVILIVFELNLPALLSDSLHYSLNAEEQ